MGEQPYQVEPPDSIRSAIWSSGEISPLQLFRIAAWKSAKGLALLSLNGKELIREVTGRAMAGLEPFETQNVLRGPVDWEQWTEGVRAVIGSKPNRTGLLALDGVGYPMASAILAYLAPGAFPVIDKWTVRAVFGVVPTSRWQRAASYAAFAKYLCQLAPIHYPQYLTIHEVDQAVMNAIMGCREPRPNCKHVPYSTIDVPTS